MTTTSDRSELRAQGVERRNAALIHSVLGPNAKQHTILIAALQTGAGAALRALLAHVVRGGAERVLYLVPQRLMGEQVLDRLAHLGLPIESLLVDGQATRERHAATPEGSPWGSPLLAVTTPATLLKVGSSLLDVDWDWVVLDEIDGVPTRGSASENRLQRHVSDFLKKKPKARLLAKVTTLPLDEFGLEDLAIIELPAEVRDWENQKAGDPITSRVAPFTPSAKEADFATHVASLGNLVESNEEGQRFVEWLQDAASSSFNHFERELRSERNRLAHGVSRHAKGDEDATKGSPLVGLLWRDKSAALMALGELLERLETLTTESKARALVAFIQTLRSEGHQRVAVFTRHTATAAYLSSLLEDAGTPVRTLNGSMSLDELNGMLEPTTFPTGVLVLGDKLVNEPIPGCTALVHYDVPVTYEAIVNRMAVLDVLVRDRAPVVAALRSTAASAKEVQQLELALNPPSLSLRALLGELGPRE